MIVVLSGSNRPRSRTLVVARALVPLLEAAGAEARLMNLEDLPGDLFVPTSYGNPPPSFQPYQAAISGAEGVLTVVPEYNGSYPGALKYFIDLLKFPESLHGVAAGFVGIASGEWGGLRAVEHLQQVFRYRRAHIYGHSVYVREVHRALDPAGQVQDAALRARLEELARGFVAFCRQVRGEGLQGA
ncbi:MAG: NAD(P)H-dependent oxidoreductase [Planctomycetes bacterium]|nr:NAD(P)H-dependent oxidoreductase [Planctomycetota bacterium]